MRAFGAALIFLTEVSTLVALAWLSVAAIGGWLGWVVAAAGVAAVAVLWGRFRSPPASPPLAPTPTLAARTLILLSGAFAFAAVGLWLAAGIHAGVVIIGTSLAGTTSLPE